MRELLRSDVEGIISTVTGRFGRGLEVESLTMALERESYRRPGHSTNYKA